MNWIIFALAGPLIWALVNHIDKFIITKYFHGKGIGSLVMFTGLSGFVVSIFIIALKYSSINLGAAPAFFIAINGALLVASFIPYLHAMEKEEASTVSTLYQLIPVFGYFLGLIFLHEQLSFWQLIGSSLIIIGAVSISLDFSSKIRIKLKPLLLMALSSLMIATNGLVFKIIALEENFWGTAFWEYIGGTIFVLFLFFCIPLYRRQFVGMIKKNKSVISVNFLAEILNIIAKLFANFASLLAPLVLVWVVNSFQPFFVLLYGLILTLLVPKFYRENISKTILIQKVSAIAIIVLGTYFLFK
ncbi:MAG: EamA family transporter [Candidatus Falkowbacteria bacterium]|nr:EamA family transporter [Candidatus Falkowbacteria bacterium]